MLNYPHAADQVKEDTINVVFVGKPRGLSDLAHRQRKPGQWVSCSGWMTFVSRSVEILIRG